MNKKGSAITILSIFFAVILMGASLVAALIDWAWVDIQTTKSGQKLHLKFPVPISLAGLAWNFVPQEEKRLIVPREIRENRELILGALQVLEECPDAILINVRTPDARVIVKKSEGKILFDVEVEDATVQGSFAIKPVLDTLKKWNWDRLDPGLGLEMFTTGGSGNYLYVDADGVRVKIAA